MKTLGSLIFIGAFIFLTLYGVVLVFNQAGAVNSLDAESIKLISQYDAQLEPLIAQYNDTYEANKDLPSYEPDANTIGDEAKEFFETKDKVNQIKSTSNLMINAPDLLFLSIPFVDEGDLSIYKVVLGLLAVIVIFVAGISAFFGKFWGSQG